eukprot:67738-Hanusia_phi.AAC.1
MSSVFSPKQEHPLDDSPNPWLSSCCCTSAAISRSGGTGSDQSMEWTMSPRRTSLRGFATSLTISRLAPGWQSSFGMPPCTQKTRLATRAASGRVSKKQLTLSHTVLPSASPKILRHWWRKEPSLYVLMLPLTSRVSWFPRIIHHFLGFSTFCAMMYATTGRLSAPLSTKSPRNKKSAPCASGPAGHRTLRKKVRSSRFPWMSPST